MNTQYTNSQNTMLEESSTTSSVDKQKPEITPETQQLAKEKPLSLGKKITCYLVVTRVNYIQATL
ncbi:hypothetical protein [Lysinibacillus xylanilyticus]|uniref:hypothetical protein n=1 Tax=Lysinibacillus xylanilyticus TaxID=582475 RepID=UPI0038094960